MPTHLSRLFVRGRSRKGDVAAFGLRLVSALLNLETWPRSLEGACRLARRHRNCQLAVGVVARPSGDGLVLEHLAGGMTGRAWRELDAALAGRQSPLLTAGQAPVWIRLADDPFQPGAPLLRRLDLGWLQALPFPVPGSEMPARGFVLLGGRGESTDEHHPLVRLAGLIWMIARNRLVAGDGDGAATMDASWEHAPVALARVAAGKVLAVNPAARELLQESVGRDGTAWEAWLLGAVQRLQVAGREVDVVRASQSRACDLQVRLGAPIGDGDERLVALTRPAAPAETASDHEATMRALGHELRTPLSAMNTSLQLVLRGDTGDLTPDQERFLGATKRNLERLNRLLADLLETKRAEAGQAVIHPATVDVGELLHQDLALFAVTAEEKGLELETSGVPPSFHACVDADKMQQILHNVLTNALKYTPRDGLVRVGLDGTTAHAPGLGPRLAQHFGLAVDTLTLTVEDSGMGMSESYLQQLFEPFSRDQRTETTGLPGVGLGLYITRGLVEAHGGEVRLMSEPGRGTTVWVVLPREPESARVLTVGRRLAGLPRPEQGPDFHTLDLRHRIRGVPTWQIEAAGRHVQQFLGELARRDGQTTDGGELGWPLAPGLWVAGPEAGRRLGPAWEVFTAAPECPVLLAGTAWQPTVLSDGVAAPAVAPRTDTETESVTPAG
ncbi:hypothetical protein GF314_15990 [bacterium]|nr:hypothetical protein [bacterium]